MVRQTKGLTSKTSSRHATANALARFARREDGAMTYLAVATALVTIAFAGLGIDMIQAEVQRAKIQATLDRAVLAAADLDNTLDPSDVVYDYFRKMGLEDTMTSDPIVEKKFNYKRVTAEASTKMPGNFSTFIGVDHFAIGGLSRAEEWVNNVEVSLVLDISGSMADNNKLVNMREAAKVFVDTVIDDDFLEQTSVTLVPYSEHVNAGPYITSAMKVDWKHGFSHCLEIPDDHFYKTELDLKHTYEQMQHFQWNYWGDNLLTDTVCPQYDFEEINPFQNSKANLKAQIAQLTPRAGTAIFMGMKWAVGLLDDDAQPIVTSLIAQNKVPEAFAGRPFAFDYRDNAKHIVLMTDGQHSNSYRLQSWAYNDPSDIYHWSDYNMWYFMDKFVTNSWSWENYYYQRYNMGYGDGLLDRICDAAKAKGITIWSIAFETEAHGKQVMSQCASSPAHYFDAAGTELKDVFYSIARSINQLRLTQ